MRKKVWLSAAEAISYIQTTYHRNVTHDYLRQAVYVGKLRTRRIANSASLYYKPSLDAWIQNTKPRGKPAATKDAPAAGPAPAAR